MLRDFLHSEDDGQPQGGGADEQSTNSGKVRASDLRSQLGGTVDEQALMRILEKQADLFNDNKRYRTKLDRMQEVPKGARVLTADDAAAYDAYLALGKPDEISKALADKTAAEQRLSGMERDATLRDVRDVTGYDLDILKDIGGAEWQYSIKDETIDEKPARVVYVKDGDKEQRIDQHPKVVKFLPALKPSASPPAPSGTAYPAQSAGGTAPKLSPAAAYINRAYSKETA